MLDFRKTNIHEVRLILSGFANDEICHISSVLEGKDGLSFASADGSCIFMTENRGAEFTFPVGDNWQSVIALLVTFTREHYLPLNFIGVKEADVNRLLSMFPNYDPVITRSAILRAYDVSL